VPSVLSSKPLDCARAPTKLTAFIVFAATRLFERWGTTTDLRTVVREGFYPLGVFARLVCRAVGWMQTVGNKIPAQQLRSRLSAKEACLSFGRHEFALVLSEAQGCVRVEIAGDNPREVVYRLERLLGGKERRAADETDRAQDERAPGGVLDECASSVGARVAVPVDGGYREKGYADYEGELLLLDGELVRIAAQDKGVLLTSGLITPEQLRENLIGQLQQFMRIVKPAKNSDDNEKVEFSGKMSGRDDLAAALQMSVLVCQLYLKSSD